MRSLFYKFTPELKVTMQVVQSEDFILELHDCFSRQLKSEKGVLGDQITNLIQIFKEKSIS